MSRGRPLELRIHGEQKDNRGGLRKYIDYTDVRWSR
jgi:hypothetical protein